MSELTVALPEALRDWIDTLVETGRYPSSGDYLRALIARDRTDDAEREALVAELEAGERSGISERRVPQILAALRSARDVAIG